MSTSKRQVGKSKARQIGDPSQEDAPNARLKAVSQGISSISYSTRQAPDVEIIVPNLETLCCRVFANALETLFGTAVIINGVAQRSANKRTEVLKKRTRAQLLAMPPHLSSRLLNTLRLTHPGKMTHTFLSEYFLCGTSIKFTGSMKGVNSHTLENLGPIADGLTGLELSGLEWIGDARFAELIVRCRNLVSLSLKWSSKAAAKTARAICSCKSLQKLNLNYTAIPPAELAPIILACPPLCVLKAASLPDFTDNAMHKIVAALEAAAGSEPLFPALKSLKLKRTSISETHLINFLKYFPSLETLDLSFTSVRNIPFRKLPASELSLPPLSKLILTSTQLHPGDICAVLPQLPKLRKLHLGALPTFSDSHLSQLTKSLFDHCPEVDEINLVRNTRLGDEIGAYNALPEFIRRIGRKCRHLNLASTSVTSHAFEGLLPGPLTETFPHELVDPLLVPDTAPLLRTLNLNRTKIDDTALQYISACADLENLELESTRASSEGLCTLIDKCSRLEHLNLSGCRGVAVKDRRKFFEVWEATRHMA